MYSDHYQAEAMLAVDADQVLEVLDDPGRLVGHMSSRSLMMAGGKMSIDLDELGGRAPGSIMRLHGRMLGFALEVEERVTERQAPQRKVWETLGEPRLLVLTGYRMGFDICSRESSTLVSIWIDFSRPESGIWRWLGRLLGPWYARWCIDRMVADTQQRFASSFGADLEAGRWR